jgi:(R)-2-hydroxyglutarate dehydrogenase
MLPRISDMPAPAPLHSDFIAELRLRGFEGDLAPAYSDRIVSATDNSIYQLLPAHRFPP